MLRCIPEKSGTTSIAFLFSEEWYEFLRTSSCSRSVGSGWLCKKHHQLRSRLHVPGGRRRRFLLCFWPCFFFFSQVLVMIKQHFETPSCSINLVGTISVAIQMWGRTISVATEQFLLGTIPSKQPWWSFRPRSTPAFILQVSEGADVSDSSTSSRLKERWMGSGCACIKLSFLLLYIVLEEYLRD